MELTKIQEGRRVTVAVSGTIDTETSQQLSKELLALDYSDLDLTLDFSNTKYITSAGLRVLLVARKKLTEDTMRITGVNESIAEVFETTGFAEMFPYTLQSAVDESCYKMSFKALLKKKRESGITKPVFVFREREYTWEDVDKASQIIASDLAKAGVKKGSHVGICCPNSINWVFAFFAVQKLGGIAVLLNFGLKPAEVRGLAEIGGITHLCYGETAGVTSFDDYAPLVTDSGCSIEKIFNISADVDFTKRYIEYVALKDKFDETFHADDASVVIFTSGSTGKPKAVLSSAYNMLSSVAPLVSCFKVTGEDRNCAFLPFFHVFGFVTSISIGMLVDDVSYIPDRVHPQVLLDMIDKYQCTLFHSVPTMVLAMTQLPTFSPERVASLRVSALGGAVTTENQMKALRRLFPNDHFCNVYGMSENAAISITGYEDTVEHVTQTVGKPVDGVEVEIRDVTTGKPLGIGQAGEICIRSNTMIVCYYRLAIDKQPLDDEGWLATGDLGVLGEDGYIRLTGRAKDLIIRGGENISPAEVADAVAALPEIADVKVVGVPNELLGEEVAAAVILRPGARLDEEKAREILGAKLAKFKLPKYFVVFESFPVLGSGKIDAASIKKTVAESVGAK